MRKALILSAVLIVIVILVIGGLYLKSRDKNVITECYQAKEHVVAGGSLSGIIEMEERVNVLFGYYDCNEIKPGEIVAYDYAGNKDPIIKIIKAVPGDSFFLKESEEGSGWNIFVNNEIVVNSENQPYLLNDSRYKMLSLYVNDHNGVIPEDSYLILGNKPSGSIDSTVFGLVHRDGILGKVKKAI